MKDAEMPEVTAYDLEEVVIYTDSDGEPVTSLVLNDEPRQPDDDLLSSGIPPSVPHITRNHTALWRCINQRISQNKPCTRALLRDDLRAKGINVEKKFSRWLEKLLREQLIVLDGEQIRLPDTGNDEGTWNLWGDTLAGTRLPTLFTFNSERWGCPFNPRHCCAHGIHLREYGEPARKSRWGNQPQHLSLMLWSL